MDEIILEAKDVCFSYEYDERHSLNGCNIQIKKGKKTAFMGSNGSGKSTFFLCCNGIHKPQKGEMWFAGKPICYTKKELLNLRSRVGIVFQDPDNQLFSASVKQEISFGILNLGVSVSEAEKEVAKVMEHLKITSFQERPVHALSGGQKKQVSIADILVMHPEVIILDEPAAALDPKHTKIVNQRIDQLTEEGVTVIMATHDVDYAYAWADEIVLMHEGRALRQGRPEDIFRDIDALKQTNLEKPKVLRFYDTLCKKGMLEKQEQTPRTLDELEQLLG